MNKLAFAGFRAYAHNRHQGTFSWNNFDTIEDMREYGLDGENFPDLEGFIKFWRTVFNCWGKYGLVQVTDTAGNVLYRDPEYEWHTVEPYSE